MEPFGRSIPRHRVAFWALAAVALLLSHDAVFAVQMGPGEAVTRALRDAGHGYWGALSGAIVIVGALAAIGVATSLIVLRRRARRLGAVSSSSPGRPRAYVRRAVVAWAWLFAVVALGFVVQENLEHAGAHGHLPGFGALIGPEYPLALPVITVVSLIAGLLSATVVSIERQIVDSIVVALRSRTVRAPRSLGRAPVRISVRRPSPLSRAEAGRAPPRLLVPA